MVTMNRPETKHFRIWPRRRGELTQGKQKRKRRDCSEPLLLLLPLLPELPGLLSPPPPPLPWCLLSPLRPRRPPKRLLLLPDSASSAKCNSAGSGPSNRLRSETTDGGLARDVLLLLMLSLRRLSPNLSAATAGGVARPGYCVGLATEAEDRREDGDEALFDDDGGGGGAASVSLDGREDPRVHARLTWLEGGGGTPW